MLRTTAVSCPLALTLACTACAMAGSDTVGAPGASDSVVINISNDQDHLVVTREGDAPPRILLNGQQVASDHLVADGEFTRVLDANAHPVFTLAHPDGGWFASSDPAFSGKVIRQVGAPKGVLKVAGAGSNAQASGKRHTTINTNDPSGQYSVVLDDGQIVSASMNGQTLPADRVMRQGDTIIFLDEKGQGIYQVNLGPQGGGHVALTTAAAPAPGARVRIGVTMGEVGEAQLATQLGVNQADVVVITSVIEGAPAEKAGLKPFDIVLQVDGKSPANEETVRSAVQSKQPGDDLRLRVLRKGAPMDLDIKVEKVEPEHDDNVVTIPQASKDALSKARGELNRLRGMGGGLDASGKLAEELRKRFEEELTESHATIDDATRRKIEEALTKAAQSMSKLEGTWTTRMPEIELFQGQGNGRGMVLLPPNAPLPPTPPAPPGVGAGPTPPQGNTPPQWRRAEPRNPEQDDRLKSLEKRLDHLETLLERLIEEKKSDKGR